MQDKLEKEMLRFKEKEFNKKKLLDVEMFYYEKGDEVKYLEPLRELLALRDDVKFEDCCEGYRMKASKSLRVTIEILEEGEQGDDN